MPMVKLVYFDAEARGEVARILLAAGNIHYEDSRISFAEWPKYKASTPFGQIPVLHWDGEELGQSWAINKFITSSKLRFETVQADRETGANALIKEFFPKVLAPLETTLKKRGG